MPTQPVSVLLSMNLHGTSTACPHTITHEQHLQSSCISSAPSSPLAEHRHPHSAPFTEQTNSSTQRVRLARAARWWLAPAPAAPMQCPARANFVVVPSEPNITHDVTLRKFGHASFLLIARTRPLPSLKVGEVWCGASVVCWGVAQHECLAGVACRHRVRGPPHTHHQRCTRPLSVW
jgi:hypothetical protein